METKIAGKVQNLPALAAILNPAPYDLYSLFQFEGSDVISVLKNSIGYIFVFFRSLLVKNETFHQTAASV